MRLFRRAPAQLEWVVIDLETTGLRPTTDRIVEIALVRLDQSGQEMAAWTTLVDPERDPGPTRIHGLTARHLKGAPTFDNIARDLLGFIADGVVVAHNARFDTAFLNAECARAGIAWGPIVGLCTMATASAMGICASRSLADICEELGIPLTDHHAALADARATATLLLHLLPPSYELPVAAPHWPRPSTPCAVRLRTDPPVPRGGRRVESQRAASPYRPATLRRIPRP